MEVELFDAAADQLGCVGTCDDRGRRPEEKDANRLVRRIRRLDDADPVARPAEAARIRDRDQAATLASEPLAEYRQPLLTCGRDTREIGRRMAGEIRDEARDGIGNALLDVSHRFDFRTAYARERVCYCPSDL
ncbi:MAG: hypothetical protein E6I72_09550 [Chloroflexi bacterium]|nr:MAG: hypothetical protein E6I72_09550 [Chloroflexota bacterium]